MSFRFQRLLRYWQADEAVSLLRAEWQSRKMEIPKLLQLQNLGCGIEPAVAFLGSQTDFQSSWFRVRRNLERQLEGVRLTRRVYAQ